MSLESGDLERRKEGAVGHWVPPQARQVVRGLGTSVNSWPHPLSPQGLAPSSITWKAFSLNSW